MTYHEAIIWVEEVLAQVAIYAGDAATNGDLFGFIQDEVTITDTPELRAAYTALCAYPPVDELAAGQQWEVLYRRYIELSMEDA